MTVPVPDQLEYISDADGVTKDFAYPKRFLQKSEIVVAFRSNNSDTIKSLGIDYTIAGTSWPSGADVSFAVAPPAGVQVVRYRRTAITQTVDLENNQRNDAPSVELQLDRLTMALQDSDKLARGALRTDAAEGYRLAPPVAEKLLAWDADGKAVVSSSKTLAELDAGIAGAQAAKAAAEAARDRAVTAESNAEVSKDAAASSATSANASKNSAANSATGAASSADLAGTRAAQASSSATAASGSASAAATQATNASNSATAAAGSAATASTKATEAGQSAATSASSASAAQAASMAAESARDSANTSAANANTSATASEASAAAALASKNIAQGFAIDAANSATVAQSAKAGAETAEGAAASSATAAGNSAASAASSATDAGESKDAAAASATSALSSATSAGSSASAASASATNAQSSANLAQSVTASMSGGTSGQFLVKKSNTDYDYEWANVPGGGDMLASVYDTSGKAVDAFSMSNMDEGADAKILTAAERTAIAANTDARHSHNNKTILDAITAAYTTAEKTKLAGIATGATANTGTVTSVAVSVPTGLSVANSPVTTSGTIAITYASGYQGYTTTESSKLSGIETGAQVNVPQVQTDWNAASGLASIANKPSEFPPSAHTHTPSQVGLGNVANKSEAQMVASGAIADALAGKLPIGGTAANSLQLGGETAEQWQAKFDGIPTGGLGIDQTWQSVSRSNNTSYQNTTGEPICVAASFIEVGSSTQTVVQIEVSSDNSSWLRVAADGDNTSTVRTSACAQAVVPNGWYYRILCTVGFQTVELR